MINDQTQEVIDAAYAAVKGVTARFDRKWYLKAARDKAPTQEMWKCMAAQGLLGIGVPEAYGGYGGGITGPVAVM